MITTEITSQAGEIVEIDGLRTYAIKTGTGPAVVLIHGGAPGACARVNWGPAIDPLAAAGFTVCAYDQPGYGQTDNPEDFSLEYRVRHAKAYIESLGLDRYIVLGNSQGSYIAARIALEDPRVYRLVLVASGTLAPKGSVAADAQSREHAERLCAYVPSLENSRSLTSQTLVNPERVTEELVRLRYEMSTGKNREAEELRRGTPAPRPITDELKNLKAPVLLLWGAQDSGAALERSLLLLQSIPGAELHIFDRCGHWVQWDQADRFNTIVRDFLTAPR
jgi:pimeloyl-ACP methyl ester carboxylesterase